MTDAPGPYDETLKTPGVEPTLPAPMASRPAPRGEAPLPPEAPEAAKIPANVQGKYVRVKRAGAGGMGEVWRAWDRALGRWVALKFMKHDDDREVARFRREAQTAAKLNHPNIAAIYEAEEAVRLAPENPKAAVRLANARIETNDVDGAIRDLSRVLEKAPGDPEALAIRGRAYMLKKDWDAALRDLEAALAESPNAAFQEGVQEYLDEAKKAREKK